MPYTSNKYYKNENGKLLKNIWTSNTEFKIDWKITILQTYFKEYCQKSSNELLFWQTIDKIKK